MINFSFSWLHIAGSVLLTSACGGASTQEPAAPVAMTTDRECGDGTVLFATGSADLSNDDRAHLDTLSACLTRRDIDTLYVTGSADPRGTAEANANLGHRRAEAVANYLRSTGCTANFVVRSRGEAGADDTQLLWPADRAAQVTEPLEEAPPPVSSR